MMPACPSARRACRIAVAGVAVLTALLLCGAAPSRAQSLGPGESVVPPEPADLPRQLPESQRPGYIDPAQGLQMAIAAPYLRMRSRRLGGAGPPESVFSQGAAVGVGAVWPAFRVGYERLIYRTELREPVTFRGETVNFVGIESDQVWLFHGVRPLRQLFLGYGAGVQHRQIQLSECPETSDPCTSVARIAETLSMAGLISEWAFAPPFALQLRGYWEEEGKLVTLSGYSVMLAYIVPL